jgi:hypothetical protein
MGGLTATPSSGVASPLSLARRFVLSCHENGRDSQIADRNPSIILPLGSKLVRRNLQPWTWPPSRLTKSLNLNMVN